MTESSSDLLFSESKALDCLLNVLWSSIEIQLFICFKCKESSG